MFGYFTPADDQNGGAEGFDAPTVTISKTTKSIHAWIKRMASKVTVAFDPSGLHQDVWIYIHDVSIRDIPMACKLGVDNTPTTTDSLLNHYNTPLSELPASSKILYNKNGELPEGTDDKLQDFRNDDITESVYSNWLTLAKGSGIKGSNHSASANALYFFENMQGDFEKNKKYDKTVTSADIDGDCVTNPNQEGYKNGRLYGTYIEVTGYYVSNNPQNTTRGKIKYRFMLGKNTTYNFNAQRNHHFKLTLGFEGWANQPKWNIEYYEQDPGLYVPDDFDVSYLYNQKHMMPIKIVGNCTSLKMEIVENNWAPYDPTQPDEVPKNPTGTGEYAFQWNRSAWANTSHTYKYKQKIIKVTDPESALTNNTQFGFLALAVPVNNESDLDKTIVDENFDGGDGPQKKLTNYYNTNNGVSNWNTGSQKVRSFTEDQLKYDGPENGEFYKGLNGWQVHRVDNDSKMLMVPLFTRNKSMIVGSGFSGNNLYESYKRKAVVRITATFKTKGGGTETIVRQVPVFQTYRVVNPKGIWHRYNDVSPFSVKLMKVDEQWNVTSNEYFSTFNSDGAWRAYVESKNKKFITLKADGKSYVGKNDTICGDTDTPIEFSIQFDGPVDSDESACAVIRVDYNGYNCVHKIMVRQGYMAPMVVKGNAKWSSFSLYSCDKNNAKTSGAVEDLEIELTTNPLALGTFFRRHNTLQGVRIINNNPSFVFNNQTINGRGPLQATRGYQFVLTDGNRKNWGDITPDLNGATNEWAEPTDFTSVWGTFKATVNGKVRTYRLPTYEEFKALEEAEFGFGVLYTDGTNATATTYDGAYGYQAPNNLEKGPDTGKGARGVIVYNKDNAHQVFFPVGKNGMGRRTQFNTKRSSGGKNNSDYNGELRYADVSYVLSDPSDFYRPVPYNLPKAPGAIYWFNTIKKNGFEGKLPSAGYDMNYFNFDFNPYPDQWYVRLKDARPIKLVVTN